MAAKSKRSRTLRIAPEELLQRAERSFFSPPPRGHFWLEHLVRTLEASPRAAASWRLYAATTRGPLSLGPERAVAVYALNPLSRYAMFHAVDATAGAELLAWALEEAPPKKVLAPYDALTSSLQRAGLEGRVTRDHRELYLRLPLGGLALEPDWRYRLATATDIPRLEEYNRIYNEERRTDWTREWREAITSRALRARARRPNRQLPGAGSAPPSARLLRRHLHLPRVPGRGEATMLVANFCAEMALSGLDVCLIVDDDNPAAIRAYGKVGFLPEGLYRTAYFLARREPASSSALEPFSPSHVGPEHLGHPDAPIFFLVVFEDRDQRAPDR